MNFLQRQSLNTKGILCLVAAVAFLAVSDAIIKWLSPDIALHEIMLFRTLFAMALMPLVFKLEGGTMTFRTRRPALHFIRGLTLVFTDMFFFLGLASMPFAEAVAASRCDRCRLIVERAGYFSVFYRFLTGSYPANCYDIKSVLFKGGVYGSPHYCVISY